MTYISARSRIKMTAITIGVCHCQLSLLAGAKRAALYIGWSQQAAARDGATPNTKLSITHSFFELQTPDFAWKFVWIVRTNYKGKKVHKLSLIHI